jgi:hypothetical protein
MPWRQKPVLRLRYWSNGRPVDAKARDNAPKRHFLRSAQMARPDSRKRAGEYSAAAVVGGEAPSIRRRAAIPPLVHPTCHAPGSRQPHHEAPKGA